MDRKGVLTRDQFSATGKVKTNTQMLEFGITIWRGEEENVVVVKRLGGGFMEYRKLYAMLGGALLPLNLEEDNKFFGILY